MQGGGQPSQRRPGGQEQPQQGSQEPQSAEKTPEMPSGQQPGEKPDQPSPTQQGEPKGEKESPAEPKNQAGAPPPKSATEVTAGDKANQQWGDLPPTVRELFTTEGGGDLPPQYRDWIDAYYRRLQNDRR